MHYLLHPQYTLTAVETRSSYNGVLTMVRFYIHKVHVAV